MKNVRLKGLKINLWVRSDIRTIVVIVIPNSLPLPSKVSSIRNSSDENSQLGKGFSDGGRVLLGF